MAFHWRADDGPTLNAGSVVCDLNYIASTPYIFVKIQGEGIRPLSPSGSAHGVFLMSLSTYLYE